MTDGVWHVFAFTMVNATTPTYGFYLNGSEVTSSGYSVSTVSELFTRTVSSNFIGKANQGNAAFNGDIREVIVLNSPLTVNQVTNWSNYLKTKWGI